MSEQDTEFQNSQESDTTPEGENQETQAVEESNESIEDLREKNKQLYARLKKEEEDAKAYREMKRKEGDAENTSHTENNQASSSNVDVERLTLKVDGYSDDEIAEIMKLGGMQSLSNPLVKKAVQAMREEREAENAQVTDGGAKSDFTRKYSPQDLRKMSTEELEKILPST